MGTRATIYRFQLELADIDRSVYETLNLRVALHPSESVERMLVRVLARALAHEEGLEFGRGLSNVEEAALWSHGLTGEVETWIEVGLPSSERLHRASKRAERLLVFTHKPLEALRREWKVRKIHRAHAIQVHTLPADFVAALAVGLERTESWFLTLQDGQLSVARGERTHEIELQESSLSLLCGEVV